MAPTEERAEKLDYLRLALHHTPGSMPFHDKSSTVYDFPVSEDDVTDLGDKNSAE